MIPLFFIIFSCASPVIPDQKVALESLRLERNEGLFYNGEEPFSGHGHGHEAWTKKREGSGAASARNRPRISLVK